VLQEEALAKSEQMLEEDAVRFDTFLKENDKKAHEAIKRAEKETKLKQDKVRHIYTVPMAGVSWNIARVCTQYHEIDRMCTVLNG
jgi:hypothetical protein